MVSVFNISRDENETINDKKYFLITFGIAKQFQNGRHYHKCNKYENSLNMLIMLRSMTNVHQQK